MFGKFKRLRASGKRLSDHEIARSDFVQGEVRVYGLGVVASVGDPASQVGEPLLPILYRTLLITMHGHGMLLYGEERPRAMPDRRTSMSGR